LAAAERAAAAFEAINLQHSHCLALSLTTGRKMGEDIDASFSDVARAFDEKAESIVDSHDGTNQIQLPHW
jgi:hypothetical protein